jgi:hypothetical protein
MADNNNSTTRFLIIGAVVVVLIIGIIYFMKGKSSDGDKSGNSKDIMSETSDPTKGEGQIGDGTSISDEGADGSKVGVTPEFLLEQYREWSQYPPNSRPLSNYNYDLIEPFFVQESPIVMVDTPTSKEDNGYKCHLQPKTWAVIGPSAEMFIKLECRDKANTPIPIKIDSARVFKEFDGIKTSTVSPDYNDDGRDGDETAKDNIYTFKWRPMKQDWGQMLLEADIQYGQGKKATLTSSFFSSPGKPAEAGNIFRETIVEGSLVIHATISVIKPGTYHIEANLKEAADGNFISFATFDGSLKSGTQEVELLFFGKILNDKGYDGPYILTDVRGHRVNLAIDPSWHEQGEEGLKKMLAAKTTEPDKEMIVPFKEEYKTKPYKFTQFSKKAYNSTDKENRVRELQSMVKK